MSYEFCATGGDAFAAIYAATGVDRSIAALQCTRTLWGVRETPAMP